MQHHLFWVVFVAYFSVFNKCESKQKEAENVIPYILSQLFENTNKPPIILYLEPRQNVRSIEEDLRENVRFIEENPEDFRENVRSIEENLEDLGENVRSIEENQEDLRQNIRSVEENPGYLRDVELDEEIEDDSDENSLRTSQSDERAYILYHLLRTTMEEEHIDPTTVQNLQPAKEFLRNAFIGRCRKLKRCLRQCPEPKIKYTCTVQCKQVFDDLDECDEPKQTKCETSKCGNTMPPTWLL